MDRGYYLNAGIPPLLHFESSPPPTWQTLSSAPELNCSPELSSDCFLNPSWDKSTDQFCNFESTLSSMVSSPSPAAANDSFGIRELIGKLGTICNSVDIPPQSYPFPAVTVSGGHRGGNNSTITSRYSIPSNSPPKKESPPNSGHSIPTNPNFLDTGIAKGAEKFFSSLASHSFNGRTSQPGLNNTELLNRPSPLMMASVKFPRVSSTPSLRADGSPMGPQESKNSTKTQVEIRSTIASNTKLSKIPGFLLSDRSEFASPNEGPSVSEQNPSGEVGLRTPTDSNSRKRKAVSRGKSSVNTTKVAEAEDEPNAKRSKSTEGNGNDNVSVKTEEERKRTINGVSEDHKADDPKPPEPQKDYIHVRARRGQATDSHSLAERVRREKISERMKLLQDLVPGCNKVTGKALMLEEIINYVQSLQRQVEFLSMKLASVNPRLDFNMEGLLSKDVFQPNRSFPHPTTYPLDSSESSLFGQQTQGIPQVRTNEAVAQSAGDPIDTKGPSNGFQFDEFGQGGLTQFSTPCEDDLQSIVQTGFGQHKIEL